MFARYADTVHFRAPYKEAYFHGVGADPSVFMQGVKDSRGWSIMTASDAQAVRAALKSLVVATTSTDEKGYAVAAALPLGPGVAGLLASEWVTSQLRAGYVVLVQFGGAVQYMMVAIPKANTSDIAQKSLAAPVYAEPSLFDAIGITPLQAAIAAGVIVGLVLIVK